jgi:HEAT repeat protein
MINTPEEQRRSAAALGRALDDREEDIRFEVVRALGYIDPALSGRYLSKAMRDESVRVRVQVIQELREAYGRQSGQLQAAGSEQ